MTKGSMSDIGEGLSTSWGCASSGISASSAVHLGIFFGEA